ncbi:MAG: threalose-6-phosphate phosphatase [Watsoniomyces obsoletus]|nr:MAG: threalose-6-phosphate phosphatase [Watsoniomyces obsoletus]
MAPIETNIDFYTWGTPNGHKISILLEELGLKYNVHPIDISTDVQKEEWFLKINPNGRIPAIIDRTETPDGKPQEQRVFEGAAILLYLTARYDPEHQLSYPYDSAEHWEMVSWLAFQHGGIGPMQGQANHFANYAPEKIPYAISRYLTETKRLFGVVEKQLELQAQKSNPVSGGPWLVGDRCTIADLASFSWIYWVDRLDIDLTKFPRVSEWRERITARPTIQRGLAVPEPHDKKEMAANQEENLKKAREWILRSQKADQEKYK